MSTIKKNYIYNTLYQILLVILPLITTPYISRVLGADGVGIFSFTYSITSYFILFGTLGVFAYGRREIAFHQKDKATRSEIFWNINIIKWLTMSIAILIYFFFFSNSEPNGLYYKIFAIELLANMFDISWYFQGLENFKPIVMRNIIIKLVSVGLIFTFIHQKSDLGLYILIFTGSTLISNLSLWLSAKNTLQKTTIKLKNLKPHLLPILSMLLPQITIEIYTVLDRTMLGVITNNMHELGIYEQSQKIEKVSLSVVTALGPVMGARIANLYAQKNTQIIKQNLQKSFHFIWLLATPIALGLFSIAGNLVPWFLGDDFSRAVPVIQIGTLLVFAIAISNIIGYQFLIPTNRQNALTLSLLFGAIINVIGNATLIPFYGSIGAIISSVAAESIIALTQIVLVKRELSVHLIFKNSPKIIFSGLVMCVAVLILSNFLTPSPFSTLIEIIAGAIVYLISLLLLRDKLFLSELKNIKSKLKPNV